LVKNQSVLIEQAKKFQVQINIDWSITSFII
jgi:hypothetical protein